jgi:hypothetical protein
MKHFILIAGAAALLSACKAENAETFTDAGVDADLRPTCSSLLPERNFGAANAARMVRGAILKSLDEGGSIEIGQGITIISAPTWRLAANQHLVCLQSTDAERDTFALEQELFAAAGP